MRYLSTNLLNLASHLEIRLHLPTNSAEEPQILLGAGASQVCLDPRYANRHGLIAGATGTGKTVTSQVMAESFSRMGVPVFVSDVKGDLSGISQPGSPHPKTNERIQKIGITDF